MSTTLLVLAKRPVPGRVKTRLTPDLSPAAAAEVAAAALHDTLDAASDAPAVARTLSFDGDPTGWLRPGWTLHEQPSGGLDVRIASALASARTPALLVGMDTPQLDTGLLTAFDPASFDACLGPCADGGYWCLGLRDPRPAEAAVHGVPMSSADTYAAQLDRLHALGMRVQVLPELTDVDTVADAVAVAAHAPHTGFARTLARVREQAAA